MNETKSRAFPTILGLCLILAGVTGCVEEGHREPLPEGEVRLGYAKGYSMLDAHEGYEGPIDFAEGKPRFRIAYIGITFEDIEPGMVVSTYDARERDYNSHVAIDRKGDWIRVKGTSNQSSEGSIHKSQVYARVLYRDKDGAIDYNTRYKPWTQ